MRQEISNAAFLIIGNEILNGKVEEANLGPLARCLRSIGIELSTVEIIGDNINTVAAAIRRLSSDFDMVITSGGVGPTHDDITMKAIASAFDSELWSHPEYERLIKDYFSDKITPEHLRMALIPKCSRLASSQDVNWPTVVVDNVWVLPGIPEVFRSKLLTLREQLKGTREFHSFVLKSTQEEGLLTRNIDIVAAQFPDVEVGSYPRWFSPEFKTKLTFDSEQLSRASLAAAAMFQLEAANTWVSPPELWQYDQQNCHLND